MSTNQNSIKGIGGAPMRATTLPDDPKARKGFPVVSGVLDYFPDAIVAISELSQKANDQHNPGKPMHWDRSKSGDEADTLGRHLLQRGTRDTDGMRHSAKMAWRALALLQKEIEAEQQQPSAEYPLYWLHRPNGTVYKAVSPDCLGQIFEMGRWSDCGSIGGPMINHVKQWAGVYVPITAEEAKKRGAQV